MNNLVIALVLVLSFAGGSWFARGWYEGSVEKDVITDQVENHNDDVLSLAKDSEQVVRAEKQLEDDLARVEGVDTSLDCPVVDFERMWNEAAAIANSVRVED